MIRSVLFLAVRPVEEQIPHYAQQLRERVRPDMITLGSLSLQQVRATKRNICVIIPYSPAHQPCPLCCVSVANGHRVCACVRVHLSVLSICMCVTFSIFSFLAPFFVPNLFSSHCHLCKSSAFHFQSSESLLNALI